MSFFWAVFVVYVGDGVARKLSGGFNKIKNSKHCYVLLGTLFQIEADYLAFMPQIVCPPLCAFASRL